MKRSMNEQSIPTGSSYSWKIGSYANSVRFLLVAFKKTAGPSFQTNNALFTENDGNNQITSLRVRLNNSYYPIDGMKFNFHNYNVAEPYNAFKNICWTLGFDVQITLQEFIDLHSMFLIDLSAQPETLKSNGIDITLQIEKASALTLQGFALVSEDSYHQIDVGEGKMLRIR